MIKNMRASKNHRERKAQIFSLDVMVAFFVLVMILSSALWLWNTAREKLQQAESRNDLELKARNAIYSLIQTVGDPPAWNKLSVINDTTVHSFGIGKNRPWFIDEEKAIKLSSINDTHYDLIKKILTIRKNDFYLNVSRYNTTTKAYDTIALVGKYPNNAKEIVRIERLGLNDDMKWMKIIIYVWK